MAINFKLICIFIILVVGVSCSTEQTLPLNPVPTSELTPTAITINTSSADSSPLATHEISQFNSPLSPIVTPIPTFTPTPTVTPTSKPTETPEPIIRWSNEVEGSVIFVGTFSGKWSPTANELLLNNCVSNSDEKAIAQANAPDFKPVDITPDNFDCSKWSFPDMIWTPDGQNIIYGNRLKPEYPDTFTLWLMGHDGDNPHLINIDDATGKDLTKYYGWMDNQILIFQHYGGGGWNYISAINVYTGQSILFANIPGSMDRTQTNSQYLGATTFREMRPSAVVINKMGTVRRIPVETIEYGKNSITEFKGWLPNTNQMLVLMTSQDENNKSLSQFLLWNVEDDTFSTLVSDSVGGLFSPNGNTFAYLTCGPAQLAQDNVPIPRDNPVNVPYCKEIGYYLQLLDMKTGKVMTSLPIIEKCVAWIENVCGNDIAVDFSPDSRFVSFLRAGEQSQIYLNTLDVESGQIIFSKLSSGSIPVWTSNSRKFVYRDERNFPVIYDLVSDNLIPITIDNGQRINQIQWSFDNQYLSFRFENNEQEFILAVLPVPQG